MVLITLPEPVIAGLKVAGPAFFLSMQGSSIQTASKIFYNKSVGELSAVPFASLLTNCVIWTLYGYLRKDNTVFLPNAVGILAGAGCLLTYQKYSNTFQKNIYFVVTSIILLATWLFSKGNYQLLGSIGCLIAVVLSGSPLVTVGKVLKTKSTASLPFAVSLSTWLNALSWTLYGAFVANDPLIYGPNSLGLALASLQLALFAIFGFGNKETIKSKEIKELF